MGISLGSTAISDLKVGGTQVDKVYLGEEVVWEKKVPVTEIRIVSSNPLVLTYDGEIGEIRYEIYPSDATDKTIEILRTSSVISGGCYPLSRTSTNGVFEIERSSRPNPNVDKFMLRTIDGTCMSEWVTCSDSQS